MDDGESESEPTVTDYKAAYEAERARAGRLKAKLALAKEAKRSFLATVSHEIRTPLNGIMTVAQMLITDQNSSSSLSDKQKRQIQTILKCSVQLLMCVNDILDYAKLKSKSLRIVEAPFSLPDFMQDINEIFTAQADERQINYAPSLQLDSRNTTHYMGDEKRVRQVLQNLYNNALRFSPPNSHITLLTYIRPHEEEQKQRLYFVLTDGGPGIQHEEAELIFDPFRQSNTVARQQGSSTATTGLGLAIARGLAEQMGGKLWLDTSVPRAGAEPQGARFVFYVTLTTTEAEAHMLKEQGHVLRNKRVLIVDDMLENRLHLAQLAAKWLMLPHLCSSGEEALLYLHTMSYEFDVGWVDVHMLGMSGVELAQEIRKGVRTAAMPLISLSSVGNEFANKALFNVALEKPIVEQHLLKHTIALLRSLPPPSSTAAAAIAAVPRHISPRALNILIADDDETSRQVLLDVLEMFPAHQIEHVKVVNDGDQALRHLLPPTQRYDVAILDILMPGTNGLECARKIRPKHAATQCAPAIVIVTANVSEQMRRECVEVGVDAFLTKPLEIQDIFSVLQRVYDHPRARPGA